MYRKNEATSTLKWTLKPEISIESSRQAGFVQLTLEFRIALQRVGSLLLQIPFGHPIEQ